jgi:ACS family glucarate transporter-like MFS transporter
VKIPYFAVTTGTANSFFVFAATMNVLAVVAWLFMNPLRELKAISPQALKIRLGLFLGIVVAVVSAVVYTQFILPDAKNTDASEVQNADH